MNNVVEAVVVLKNPFQSIRNLVKKERGTAKPKWEVKVYIVLRLPVYAQQVPVRRVDWYKAGSHFDISISINISIRKIGVNRGYISISISTSISTRNGTFSIFVCLCLCL